MGLAMETTIGIGEKRTARLTCIMITDSIKVTTKIAGTGEAPRTRTRILTIVLIPAEKTNQVTITAEDIRGGIRKLITIPAAPTKAKTMTPEVEATTKTKTAAPSREKDLNKEKRRLPFQEGLPEIKDQVLMKQWKTTDPAAVTIARLLFKTRRIQATITELPLRDLLTELPRKRNAVVQALITPVDRLGVTEAIREVARLGTEAPLLLLFWVAQDVPRGVL